MGLCQMQTRITLQLNVKLPWTPDWKICHLWLLSWPYIFLSYMCCNCTWKNVYCQTQIEWKYLFQLLLHEVKFNLGIKKYICEAKTTLCLIYQQEMDHYSKNLLIVMAFLLIGDSSHQFVFISLSTSNFRTIVVALMALFYGSQMIGFKNKICTEWNKALRKVWHLPYSARTCMPGPLNGQCHSFDQFNIRFVKFYNRMIKWENTIVNFIAKLAEVNYNGFLNCNIMYIKWKYNVNMLKQNMYECNHVFRRCAKPPWNYVPRINLLKRTYLGRGLFKVNTWF